MNTNNNKYIIIYAVILVMVVAVSLTFVAMALKPKQDDNIRIEKMQNILASVHIEATVKDAITLYEQYISHTLVVNSAGEEISGVDAFAINIADELRKPIDKQQLPVFLAAIDGVEYTILPVRGKGLWGPIWGYIALQNDYNTIFGVVFDHKSETPGLGAEINTPFFEDMFKGKQIFDNQGKFVSVAVLKGGAASDDLHAVDAISGGTITSKGLEAMLMDCLKTYQEYLKIKSTTYGQPDGQGA
jgi:Na+-transporting NADH:ubiquinone oxidoreductase subunit C